MMRPCAGQHARLSGAPAVSRRRRFRVAPFAVATEEEGPKALQQLESSSSVFHALRKSQLAVVGQLTAQLGLAPAAVGSAAPPSGQLQVESADGTSAAAARAFSGPGVRWLSAATLASSSKGFGGTTVTGFAAACSDVPHLMLEQTLAGGQVRLGSRACGAGPAVHGAAGRGAALAAAHSQRCMRMRATAAAPAAAGLLLCGPAVPPRLGAGRGVHAAVHGQRATRHPPCIQRPVQRGAAAAWLAPLPVAGAVHEAGAQRGAGLHL